VKNVNNAAGPSRFGLIAIVLKGRLAAQAIRPKILGFQKFVSAGSDPFEKTNI